MIFDWEHFHKGEPRSVSKLAAVLMRSLFLNGDFTPLSSHCVRRLR